MLGRVALSIYRSGRGEDGDGKRVKGVEGKVMEEGAGGLRGQAISQK
jgi:hypothetical protein